MFERRLSPVTFPRSPLAVCGVFVSCGIFAACGPGGACGTFAACGTPNGACGPASAVVERVIDGDTVELVGGERVRYLLVDTPEVTSGHVECWGAEARAWNRSLVEGRAVRLVYDLECRDRYGRLLAYVSLDGSEIEADENGGGEVNRALVEEGYACVLHIPPDGNARVDEFRALERQAKAEGRGLWGACDPNPCR